MRYERIFVNAKHTMPLWIHLSGIAALCGIENWWSGGLTLGRVLLLLAGWGIGQILPVFLPQAWRLEVNAENGGETPGKYR